MYSATVTRPAAVGNILNQRKLVIRGLRVEISWLLVAGYLPMMIVWLIAHRVISIQVSHRQRPARFSGSRWDGYVPLVPQAAYVYFSGFILASFAVIPMIWTSYAVPIAVGYFVQFVVSLTLYSLCPVQAERPELDLRIRSARLLQEFHRLAGPYNAFPSMHASFGLYSGLWLATSTPGWIGLPTMAWCLAVVASTLLAKEHTVIDVLGGAVLGIGAFLLVR